MLSAFSQHLPVYTTQDKLYSCGEFYHGEHWQPHSIGGLAPCDTTPNSSGSRGFEGCIESSSSSVCLRFSSRITSRSSKWLAVRALCGAQKYNCMCCCRVSTALGAVTRNPLLKRSLACVFFSPSRAISPPLAPASAALVVHSGVLSLYDDTYP